MFQRLHIAPGRLQKTLKPRGKKACNSLFKRRIDADGARYIGCYSNSYQWSPDPLDYRSGLAEAGCSC